MEEETTKRHFSRAYKIAALSRMAAGVNVSALAKALGVPREYLYQWRARFDAGGPAALRGPGRQTKKERAAMQPGAVLEPLASAQLPLPAPPDALAVAQERIHELERKIGRQELELDFFQRALRHVEGAGQPSDPAGGTASTPSSRR
jgi:transposase-like protein